MTEDKVAKKPFFLPGEGYKWQKTAEKFLKGLLYTFLIQGINFTAQYLTVIESEVPPEYVMTVGLAASLLLSLENFVKHYKDDIIGEE